METKSFDVIYTASNEITDVQFSETAVIVCLKDGRSISLPLDWYPALRDATPEQRQAYTVSAFSVDWDEIDDGFSIETVLLGLPG